MPTQPASPYATFQLAARGPTVEYVTTREESIKFESGIVYSKKQATIWGNWFNFTIEEKLYAQSSHSTKISFYCDEKEVKEFQSTIQAIIDKLMAGVKPEPRFSLASRCHK